MTIRAALLGVLLVGTAAGVARADTDYPVSGSVDGFSASGTLTVQQTGNTYQIVGVDGPGVTGLLDPGDFHGNSNRFFPGGTPLLDGTGFAFTDSMGDTNFQVDIFGNANGTYGAYIVDSDGVILTNPANFSVTGEPTGSNRLRALLAGNVNGDTQQYAFSVTAAPGLVATPEPGSFALLGTGLLGAAAMVRRRSRR